MTISRNPFDTAPDGWLAFELSILRRLKFSSIAVPFSGEPHLEFHLKRWGARVSTNDVRQWAAMKALARVVNNTETLSPDEVELVLEDAYTPERHLHNLALRRWFSETDAWWFDNVRRNVGRIEHQIHRAVALSIGMAVGDYARSFEDETRELRQPSLSKVFRRIWQCVPAPVNNSQNNMSANKDAREFVAGEQTECVFIRLPRGGRNRQVTTYANTPGAWREEWIRGGDDFWTEFERARAGRLGSRIETKQQYLNLVEDLLATAAHIPIWAIGHVEEGFVSTDELVEAIGRLRAVETVYTKDFSELTGTRATIITAQA
ncbi:MAG: hypothetical protein NVSMB56_04970 [Pyrinomonadaceae bacterium]